MWFDDLEIHCLFKVIGRPSPNTPVNVSLSMCSIVSANEGQPTKTLAPSTLNIILEFGSDFVAIGNSRLRHGPAFRELAGVTYIQVLTDSVNLTRTLRSFPVVGDFVAPAHSPAKILDV